jgi:hypothetical protein
MLLLRSKCSYLNSGAAMDILGLQSCATFKESDFLAKLVLIQVCLNLNLLPNQTGIDHPPSTILHYLPTVSCSSGSVLSRFAKLYPC